MTVTMKSLIISSLLFSDSVRGFILPPPIGLSIGFRAGETGLNNKGFGGESSTTKGKDKKGKKKNRLLDSLEDKPKKDASANRPFVRSEQDEMLAQLASQAANTCIGRAVASAPVPPEGLDPFWELMPSFISSRFSNVRDEQLKRVAGMVRHALDPSLPLEDSIINDPYRPHDEIHAYMPGLRETMPFYDPSQLKVCQLLSENYEVIKEEYHALIADKKDRFQSVTSMNYQSGWQTLVLFYNGHRIPDFPYHLCPTTTKILETVPLAGRVSELIGSILIQRKILTTVNIACYRFDLKIAGFNRQQPNSGIPLHSDGNNMWWVGECNYWYG